MTQEDIKKRVLKSVKSDLDNFCQHISKWSYLSADEELNRIISHALDTAFKEWKEAVRMEKDTTLKTKRHTNPCKCVYIKGKRIGECLACSQEDFFQYQKGKNNAVDELNKKLDSLT